MSVLTIRFGKHAAGSFDDFAKLLFSKTTAESTLYVTATSRILSKALHGKVEVQEVDSSSQAIQKFQQTSFPTSSSTITIKHAITISDGQNS